VALVRCSGIVPGVLTGGKSCVAKLGVCGSVRAVPCGTTKGPTGEGDTGGVVGMTGVGDTGGDTRFSFGELVQLRFMLAITPQDQHTIRSLVPQHVPPITIILGISWDKVRWTSQSPVRIQEPSISWWVI